MAVWCPVVFWLWPFIQATWFCENTRFYLRNPLWRWWLGLLESFCPSILFSKVACFLFCYPLLSLARPVMQKSIEFLGCRTTKHWRFNLKWTRQPAPLQIYYRLFVRTWALGNTPLSWDKNRVSAYKWKYFREWENGHGALRSLFLENKCIPTNSLLICKRNCSVNFH